MQRVLAPVWKWLARFYLFLSMLAFCFVKSDDQPPNSYDLPMSNSTQKRVPEPPEPHKRPISKTLPREVRARLDRMPRRYR